MPCGTSSSVAACARRPLRSGLLSTIPPRGCSMSMGRLRRRCGARCTSVRWGRIRFRLAVRWRMRGCMCWTGGVSRCRRGGLAGGGGGLYGGGAGVARGSLNRPELTAERFVQDRFAGGRMYRTGDVARWLPGGSLEFLGRRDDQVKLRGYRIELGEVEACLASRAGVREAVVVVRGDILVAYYTGGEVPAESLRAFLSGVLPDYMVPAPGADSVVRREYQAPRGEAEEVLAGIWSGLLGVGRVGRHDNFFDLGGHSLLPLALLEQLRARTFPPRLTALSPPATLQDLAAELVPAGPAVAAGVPPNLITTAAQPITPEMLPLAALTQAEIDVGRYE